MVKLLLLRTSRPTIPSTLWPRAFCKNERSSVKTGRDLARTGPRSKEGRTARRVGTLLVDRYYAKFEVPGIWKMPLQGGEETPVLDQSGGEGWSNWALTPNGIYFITVGTEAHPTVAYFEFATHRIVRISAMDKPPGVGLAVAPDGRSILYVQNEFSESNIMLVKNLR